MDRSAAGSYASDFRCWGNTGSFRFLFRNQSTACSELEAKQTKFLPSLRSVKCQQATLEEMAKWHLMVANLDFVLCDIDSDRDYWRVPTPPCQCKGGPSDATPTGEPGGAEVPGPVPRCGGRLSPGWP
jgi:hypothetical protein